MTVVLCAQRLLDRMLGEAFIPAIHVAQAGNYLQTPPMCHPANAKENGKLSKEKHLHKIHTVSFASMYTKSACIYDRPWACLNPRGDQTHVYAPAKADDTQENDTALDGDEAEADDGGDGPDLVAGNDDRDRLLISNRISTRPIIQKHISHLPS